jgi:hypothetical protein
MRTCDSFWMSFGVVPEAMSEWNPERAPQAMVMKTKGKSGPAKTGPSPVEANSVTLGICIAGSVMAMPMASSNMVPIFIKVER